MARLINTIIIIIIRIKRNLLHTHIKSFTALYTQKKKTAAIQPHLYNNKSTHRYVEGLVGVCGPSPWSNSRATLCSTLSKKSVASEAISAPDSVHTGDLMSDMHKSGGKWIVKSSFSLWAASAVHVRPTAATNSRKLR